MLLEVFGGFLWGSTIAAKNKSRVLRGITAETGEVGSDNFLCDLRATGRKTKSPFHRKGLFVFLHIRRTEPSGRSQGLDSPPVSMQDRFTSSKWESASGERPGSTLP